MRKYKDSYMIETRQGTHTNKLQLANLIQSHFPTIPLEISEAETITYFIHYVKTRNDDSMME